MKEFNTSGPNIMEQHYTIERTGLIAKGLKLIGKERYFTIWAPRQTGKSTYFGQLAKRLSENGYKVAHINFENYKNASLDSFLYDLTKKMKEFWSIDTTKETEITKIFSIISY